MEVVIVDVLICLTIAAAMVCVGAIIVEQVIKRR